MGGLPEKGTLSRDVDAEERVLDVRSGQCKGPEARVRLAPAENGQYVAVAGMGLGNL